MYESNEKNYIVRYKLPGEKGRTARTVEVIALNQSDARKTAQATIPTALLIGGAKEVKAPKKSKVDEGVGEFAGKVGKFISRCAGKGCLAYAETPINSKSGTISIIRKRLTREIAQHTGNKLMTLGGGKTSNAKIKIQAPKRGKRTKKIRNKSR